jgi:hypothetical protein
LRALVAEGRQAMRKTQELAGRRPHLKRSS